VSAVSERESLFVRTAIGVDGEPIVLGAWCPKCEQESLPHDRHGTCMFCDTVIYGVLAERDQNARPAVVAGGPSGTRKGSGLTRPSRSANTIGRPQFDHQSLTDTLNDVAADLGRTPFKREWERFGFSPSARTYIRHFGSWSAACQAAGLDPA
jgi:hypothetical protein